MVLFAALHAGVDAHDAGHAWEAPLAREATLA
jgi:hypothetical protein